MTRILFKSGTCVSTILLIHKRKQEQLWDWLKSSCGGNASNGPTADISMPIISHIRFVFEISWSVDL